MYLLPLYKVKRNIVLIFTLTLISGFIVANASNPSSAATPSAKSPITVPGAPTDLAAITIGLNSVTLNFSAPIADGGAPIIAYRATSLPTGGLGITAGAKSGTIVITGLLQSTHYSFYLTAANSVGESSKSSPLLITTLGTSDSPGIAPMDPTYILYNSAEMKRRISVTIPSASNIRKIANETPLDSIARDLSKGITKFNIVGSDYKGFKVIYLKSPATLKIDSVVIGSTVSYSIGGKSWRAIAMLNSQTLPLTQEEGYYRGANNQVVILTRHLSYFGVRSPQDPPQLLVNKTTLKIGESEAISAQGGSGIGDTTFFSTTLGICSVSPDGIAIGVAAGSCIIKTRKSKDASANEISPLSIVLKVEKS